MIFIPEAERDMIDAGNDNTDTLDALSDADCKDESSEIETDRA